MKRLKPMDEKSTQVTDNVQVVDLLKSKKGPSEATLSFIKMFAHSYHAERSLPEEINATCLN